MGIGIRHVVWTSAALALGTFIYVVTLEPMDESENPRAAALNRSPSAQSLINQIRRSMANGQLDAARSEAQELFSENPESITAAFYNGLVERALGNEAEADIYWQMVINLAEARDDGTIGYPPNLYFYAWAQLEEGDAETGRELFGQLADQYEQRSKDGDDRWGGLGAGDHFNLACYRSLAGELDVAMRHWEMAVDLGYGRAGERGWWMVDPDLEPLHENGAFWAIGARIASAKQRDERADTREPAADPPDEPIPGPGTGPESGG